MYKLTEDEIKIVIGGISTGEQVGASIGGIIAVSISTTLIHAGVVYIMGSRFCKPYVTLPLGITLLTFGLGLLGGGITLFVFAGGVFDASE